MPKQNKSLRVWNGRAPSYDKFKGKTFNICAKNKTEAARLYCRAAGFPEDELEVGRAVREISVYFSDCWGVQMYGIEQTEPGVWVTDLYHNNPPKKII